jgi:hypothetical protein
MLNRPQPAPAGTFDVQLLGDQPDRARVESYIARRFARCHGARVATFMPRLLAATCGDRLGAALGLRPAATAPLFLETYLDAPVQMALADILGQPVQRARLVEVGNLAASNRHAGQLLVALLIAALRGAGFRWLVFTATRPVRERVAALGLPLHALAAADPARLGAARGVWGRYYDADPWVMAGDLALGVRLMHATPLAALLDAHPQALARVTQALR